MKKHWQVEEIACEEVLFTYNGQKVSFLGFANDHITNMLREAWYELPVLEFIRRRYGTGGVYVDIGAFIGTHSLYFAKVCEADLVIAIEANPEAYVLLVENTRRNNADAIEPWWAAAGARSGRCSGIVDTEHGNRGGTNFYEGEGNVPVVRADALITMPPKLIKIDAECMTYDALCGCVQTIKAYHPVMVVEDGCDFNEPIAQTMERLGYRVVFDARAEIGPVIKVWEPMEEECRRS